MFPSLLKVFLPDLRPRPAEVIDIPFLSEYQRGWAAVGAIDDDSGRRAFAPGVACLRIVEAALLDPGCHDMQRSSECFRIIECGFHEQSGSIRVRSKDFDDLHLIAVF